MGGKYKILIVDDHRIFRDGLAFVISQMENFELAGEAPNGLIFLEMIESMHVDIVLMDISMPGINGIVATAMALEKHPDLKVIALTMFCNEEYYNKMVDAGISGFVLKESGKEELAKALNTVVGGEKYYSPKLLHSIIMKSTPGNGDMQQPVNHGIDLSHIELEILRRICQGLSTSQISEELSLSHKAIETYKHALMSKTGTSNSINLTVYALKNHIVSL